MTTCLFCGVFLENNNKSTKQRKYCSIACQGKHSQQKLFDYVELSGQADSDKQARKYMLHKFGNSCSICGNVQWNGQPIPVIVDHIDGNSSNQLLTNLRVICPNCDALLPTYKNRNKGNGRASRRQRYKEGKSY